MENTSSLAIWGGAQELLQNRVMTLDEVLDEIAAVKREDIRRVANELISRQKLRMALVGPFGDGASFQALLDS
jgi:predicted Zn-dependent peptidase